MDLIWQGKRILVPGENLHLVYNPSAPPSETITDYDGNIYDVVTIGTQKWTVQNLKTTHYNDGYAIPNLSDSTSVPTNVITNWNNDYGATNQFDTFVSSASNITSAIRTSSSTISNCRTNTISVTAGEVYEFDINLSFTVGTSLTIIMINDDGGFGLAGQYDYNVGSGSHKFTMEMPYTGILRIILSATDAVDFSATCSANKLGWTDDTVGALCYYNNDQLNKLDYGALYNQYAITNIHEIVYFEKGGIQEMGWRVATNSDYGTLVATLGGATGAGGKLKQTGTEFWDTPNTDANNTSGFSALGAGARDVTGIYMALKQAGFLWTSSLGETIGNSVVFLLSYDSGDVIIGEGGNNIGISIRCVKNV